MRLDNHDKDALAFGLAVLLLVIFCMLGGGCNITRHARKSISDSTSVHSGDTSSVHKTDVHTTDENEWWRKSVYIIPGKDTTTNKILQPINNYLPQPTVIIHEEGGKNRQDVDWHTWDSMWAARFDSLAHHTTQVSTDSKTKVFSFGQIIGLVLGGIVVLVILQTIVKKFSIIKV